jgi:hypothetical protein
MKNLTVFLIILLAALWVSCEQVLDPSDFEDEFGDYRPELKIEGLLQQDKPEDSIVRIIKTITFLDRDINNGIDDDGDDEIDEEDEILPLIQDTSATVKVTNLNSGEAIDFHYLEDADSIVRLDDEGEVITIPYGGYKPVSGDFQLENYAQYQIEIYSRDFDQTITGVTTAYPPVFFTDPNFNVYGKQVTMNVNDQKEILWISDPEVTSYFLTYEEITDERAEFLGSTSRAADPDLSQSYPNGSVGREYLFGWDSEVVLRLTVEAFSPDWGRYIFSELPFKDPQRTNLLDQNGNPVMGCFGVSAANSILIIIEEE